MQTFEVTSDMDKIEFNRMPTGDILLLVQSQFDNFRFKINDGIWGSLVLTMTKFGERPSDWHKFMDHHHGRVDMFNKNNDLPFASSVAETAYQALIKTGVNCTRDQFRPALQAFIAAEAESNRKYEEFRKKRERGEA